MCTYETPLWASTSEYGKAQKEWGKSTWQLIVYIIGASVSDPLPSDVYVDFVCLSWTVVWHSNGACV